MIPSNYHVIRDHLVAKGGTTLHHKLHLGKQGPPRPDPPALSFAGSAWSGVPRPELYRARLAPVTPPRAGQDPPDIAALSFTGPPGSRPRQCLDSSIHMYPSQLPCDTKPHSRHGWKCPYHILHLYISLASRSLSAPPMASSLVNATVVLIDKQLVLAVAFPTPGAGPSM